MKCITFIILQLYFITSLYAGDRGCRIGIVDISTGEPTKASKRLYELLQMDIKEVYTKGEPYRFGWSLEGSETVTINPAKVKNLFKPMILCSNKKALGKIIDDEKLWEGLIVFEYDHKTLHARFKLFNRQGEELVLIKHPVEKSGAMKHSILKHIRRSTLTTIGLCVRFSP